MDTRFPDQIHQWKLDVVRSLAAVVSWYHQFTGNHDFFKLVTAVGGTFEYAEETRALLCFHACICAKPHTFK